MAGSCVGAEDCDPPIVCVLGPTASGKTALSLDLAETLGGEIVVMDSAQVYAGLPIGTAKPRADEVARVPHHLLGVLPWSDVCTAARWADMARPILRDIARRGRVPIICGGTFLYLRALREGLHALPATDPLIRATLEAWADQDGVAALHAELAAADPQTAQHIHPHDRQRTVRALEILRQTGRGREAHFGDPTSVPWKGPMLLLALLPTSRDTLRERIARRFRQMLDEGLWREVEAARASPAFDPGLPVMKAVGYRQLFAALDGQYTADEAIERAIIATRQYAKRQLTWLRRLPDVQWLDSDAAGLTNAALECIADWQARSCAAPRGQ